MVCDIGADVRKLLLNSLAASNITTWSVHPVHIAVARHNQEALKDLVDRFSGEPASRNSIIPVLQDTSSNRIHPALSNVIEARISQNSRFTTLHSLSGDSDDELEMYGMDSTPLHVAAFQNNRDAACLLIRCGAVVDSFDADQWTPLHTAANRHSVGVLQVLLDHGANPNSRNWELQTPLMLAFQSATKHSDENLKDIIACLREAGADLSPMDLDGHSCLWHAIKSDEPSSVLYVETNRFFLHDESSSGQHYVQTAFLSQTMSNFFLNGDYDMTSRSSRYGTIIQTVTSFRSYKTLKKVLRRLPPDDRNSLVGCRGESWDSGLYVAASGNSTVKTAILLDASAMLEFEGGPAGTALMGACEAGSLEAVVLLVRRGAKVHYVNADGKYVSGIRCAKLHPRIIQWLLVDRYIDQPKLHWRGAIQNENEEKICFWSGSQTVQVKVPRRYGVSQLEQLQKLHELRRWYEGKIYQSIG